jgi:E3 ubiquitin-protein ligase FANCL
MTQVESVLYRSTSVEAFCQDLAAFISQLKPATVHRIESASRDFMRIREEMQLIGWNSICEVDPALSFFRVKLYDDSRKYDVDIRFDLPTAFPRDPPNVTSDLPIPVHFDWDPQSSHLTSIVSAHKKATAQCVPVWTQLEGIDTTCHVQDPPQMPNTHPPRNCCKRRIIVSPQVSMIIEVNPKRPARIPKISFLGSELESSRLTKKVQERALSWDLSLSLKKNLENVLEQELPPRPSMTNEDEPLFECGICLQERLGDELPDIICDNPSCHKPYHRSCLSDWLQTKRDARVAFGGVYGVCMYCSSPIRCNLYDDAK